MTIVWQLKQGLTYLGPANPRAPYGLKIDTLSKWLAAEQAILKQFNLPWPVTTLNAATDNA